MATVTAKTDGTEPKRAPKLGQINRTKEQVLDATADLLKEIGYRELSIDRVIERSSVARSTIYRHWNNKAELAIEAFDRALGPNPPTANLGSVREDLIATYKRFPKILERSIWGTMLPSIIEASKTDPAFEGLLSNFVNARKENMRELFNRAIDRGEIRKDTNIEWAIDTLSGFFYHRLLMTGEKLNEDGLAEWLADSVLSQIKS
ncbi:transcriptional regulator, TetR family [Parasphingorhabdus marina DSM 22363]|uniref:Transcriptional regulator, TetR family n=1 Tax=Parasphingorhabdus marina DSM 22363 TaxID=1123272 RepID=A0A1N6D1B9_9SPHN|nr:TetR/AcrR family transcriptional regulator [Parasphingorhabdus marina]SIN64575.1 transcriptional regulator, TetR family [Parasphingorhabdus marina DSM 22363]